MVELDKIERLLDFSNLEDIKIGCLYLAEYNAKQIQEFMGTGRGITHNCKNVPEYLPEHKIESIPGKSLIIYHDEVCFEAASIYPNARREAHSDEFF